MDGKTKKITKKNMKAFTNNNKKQTPLEKIKG